MCIASLHIYQNYVRGIFTSARFVDKLLKKKRKSLQKWRLDHYFHIPSIIILIEAYSIGV